jgi:hypothetical protein
MANGFPAFELQFSPELNEHIFKNVGNATGMANTERLNLRLRGAFEVFFATLNLMPAGGDYIKLAVTEVYEVTGRIITLGGEGEENTITYLIGLPDEQ